MPRSKSQAAQKKQNPASVYQDLVMEAATNDRQEGDDRPLKKPRRAGPSRSNGAQGAQVDSLPEPQQDQQQPMDHTSEPESDSDDMPFEDVDMADVNSDTGSEIDDVQVSVHGEPKEKKKIKTVPRFDRERRIAAHKVHIGMLFGRLILDNSRCNDPEVQDILRPLLPAGVRKNLKQTTGLTDFQQSHILENGLKAAMTAFRGAFKVTASGMRRAFWQEDEDIQRQVDAIPHAPMMDRQAFIDAAKNREGSHDVGNQLFCALLRSAGLEARLVCSLQVLPLAGTMKPTTPQRVSRPVHFAIAPDRPLNSTAKNTPLNGPDRISIRRRLGQPSVTPSTSIYKPPVKAKVPKLDYPIYWVEILDKAYKKWIAIDPVVANLIRKPAKASSKVTSFEPPAQYLHNQLHYAIAIDSDASATDVTLRYAKAYNAKTRRSRLEHYGESGWLERLLSEFRRPRRTDVDKLEHDAMDQIACKEPMPKSIQDFQGHPLYVLVRNLRQYEALTARKAAGKVNIGTGANMKTEEVFYREDVQRVRSSAQWWRRGRKLRLGEQALKHIPGRNDQPEIALYSFDQTYQYVPPLVTNGIIPRNDFHNIDIFMPSMVPARGEHIKHPLTMAAARIVECDAVEAVTGFKFGKGGRSSSIIEGAVVPARYADAVKAVIEGLEWLEIEEQHLHRSMVALSLWKKAITALRIKARVESQYGTSGSHEAEDVDSVEDEQMPYSENLITAGQYNLGQLISLAKAKKSRKRKSSDYGDESDVSSSAENGSRYRPRLGSGSSSEQASMPVVSDRASLDAGFVREAYEQAKGVIEISDDEGGFVRDIKMDGVENDQGGFVVSPSRSVGATTASHADHMDAIQVQGGGFLTETDTIHASDEADSPAAQGSDSLLSHDPEDDEAEPDWATNLTD